MKRTIFIFAFAALGFSSCMQKESPLTEPPAIINDFFNTYEKEGVAKSLYEIFQTNPQFSEELKVQVDDLSDKLNSGISVLGRYHGFEFICVKAFGANFKQYSYLVKYDYRPIRFRFTCYKINDKWNLINFQFDDDLIDELNEASRATLLQENW